MKTLILALLILFHPGDCFCDPLYIYTFNVAQGNFNIVRHGRKALVYDCGTNLTKCSALERDIKLRGLDDCLDGVDEVRILVSHNDADHYNLIPALIFCVKSLNKKKEEKGESLIQVVPPTVGTIFHEGYALLGSATSADYIVSFLQESLDDVTLTVFKNDVGDEHDKNAVLLLEHDGLKALLTGDMSEKSMKCFFNSNSKAFYGIKVLYFPHHGSMNNGRLLYNLLDSYSPLEALPLIGFISSNPNAGTSDILPKFECLEYSSVRRGAFNILECHRVTVDRASYYDYPKPLYITCDARGTMYYSLLSEGMILEVSDGEGVLLSNR